MTVLHAFDVHDVFALYKYPYTVLEKAIYNALSFSLIIFFKAACDRRNKILKSVEQHNYPSQTSNTHSDQDSTGVLNAEPKSTNRAQKNRACLNIHNS